MGLEKCICTRFIRIGPTIRVVACDELDSEERWVWQLGVVCACRSDFLFCFERIFVA